MKPSTRTRSPGFSLTEVLVVIAVILVLAALTFAGASKMIDYGRGAKCTSNLRQIGVGLHSYIAENSGRFPDGRADVSWQGWGMCWYDAAAQNMGREYVIYHQGQPLPSCFGCPSGHGKAYEPAWPYTGDYAANAHLGSDVPTLAALKNPSATPYVQDTVMQNQFAYWIFGEGRSYASFADRHGGRGNVLWVDGHVSSFKYAEYMNYANQPSHGGIYNFAVGNW
jgi:prepilin-type processing-associated H-X9-DG protein/prepilin-type N-terminal cleavage/methylation domain-containing protein